MADHRYWLFPNNTAIFAYTPWDELPFHSIKIIQIHNKNLKSLEGLVINTKTAWNRIQTRDTTGAHSPLAYCTGKVEEFKPLREDQKPMGTSGIDWNEYVQQSLQTSARDEYSIQNLVIDIPIAMYQGDIKTALCTIVAQEILYHCIKKIAVADPADIPILA